MSLGTMIAEMRGAVPKYSAELARTHLQSMERHPQHDRMELPAILWRFWHSRPDQRRYRHSDLRQRPGDRRRGGKRCMAAASIPNSLLTQQQFRVNVGTIYNIIAFDGVSTLTLDRPYYDKWPAADRTTRSISRISVAPYEDFLAWESVVDINNAIDLCANGAKKFRDYADQFDPQRTDFLIPAV